MIRVEGLVKIYQPNDLRAVDSVSFNLESGSIGCIIGTSGCGKTTTLKMINRLVKATHGKIWVEGKESHSCNAVEWRRQIGYVIQKAGLLPHMTVQQNIALLSSVLRRSKSFIRERVRELMEIINMPFDEFGSRYPVELSGGQQQRVGIARALMENPPVLLMDEPFEGLDSITRASLHKELRDINERLKKTILIVTHDIDEAFKLGDKVILMHKGKILQSGPKKDFMDKPKNQFVADFVRGHAQW